MDLLSRVRRADVTAKKPRNRRTDAAGNGPMQYLKDCL